MRTYQGTVGLIGAGTWRPQAGGVTLRTVLEIVKADGTKLSLRNIGLTDYLGNYIKPGADVRIMVSYPIMGIFTKPYVVAVEVDGEKYKESVAHVILIKAVLYSLAVALVTAPFIGITALFVFGAGDPSAPKIVYQSIFFGLIGVNVLVWILFLRYLIKNCGQLSRF